MRYSRRNPSRELQGAVMSAALGALLLWKPQIAVAVFVFFAEFAQRALEPAIMSLAQ